MNQIAPKGIGAGLKIVVICVVVIVLFFALAPDAFKSVVSALQGFPRWLHRVAMDLSPF